MCCALIVSDVTVEFWYGRTRVVKGLAHDVISITTFFRGNLLAYTVK